MQSLQRNDGVCRLAVSEIGLRIPFANAPPRHVRPPSFSVRFFKNYLLQKTEKKMINKNVSKITKINKIFFNFREFLFGSTSKYRLCFECCSFARYNYKFFMILTSLEIKIVPIILISYFVNFFQFQRERKPPFFRDLPLQ